MRRDSAEASGSFSAEDEHAALRSKLLNDMLVKEVGKPLCLPHERIAKGRAYVNAARAIGHIEIMLDEGADPNTRSGYLGRTVLMLAADAGFREVVQMLCRRSPRPGSGIAAANVDATDRDGQTALHLACQKGHTAVIQVLMEAGACPTVLDAQNMCAVDYLPLPDGDSALSQSGRRHLAKSFNRSSVQMRASLEYAEEVMAGQIPAAHLPKVRKQPPRTPGPRPDPRMDYRAQSFRSRDMNSNTTWLSRQQAGATERTVRSPLLYLEMRKSTPQGLKQAQAPRLMTMNQIKKRVVDWQVNVESSKAVLQNAKVQRWRADGPSAGAAAGGAGAGHARRTAGSQRAARRGSTMMSSSLGLPDGFDIDSVGGGDSRGYGGTGQGGADSRSDNLPNVVHYTAQDLEDMAEEEEAAEEEAARQNHRRAAAGRRGSTLSMLSARHSIGHQDKEILACLEVTKAKLIKESQAELLQEEIDELLSKQSVEKLHVDEDGAVVVQEGAVVQLTTEERLAIDREELWQQSPSEIDREASKAKNGKKTIAKVITAD